MKFQSRNKKVEHEDYFVCPYCNTKHLKDDLEETDFEAFSDNTIIVFCKHCGWEFVPNKTRAVNYKYTNSKDKNFKEKK